MDEIWLFLVVFCALVFWCGVGVLGFWGGLLCGAGFWWIVFL